MDDALLAAVRVLLELLAGFLIAAAAVVVVVEDENCLLLCATPSLCSFFSGKDVV